MNNKKVAGIGIYEKGKYLGSENGKMTKAYRIWLRMIQRCEPGGWQQRNKPSYIGCEVHPEFIHYQDFAEWCHNQIGFGVPGYDLDKDILMPGNKVYGPYTCAFVPRELNTLVIRNDLIRGEYPIGVYYDQVKKKYRAEYSVKGRSVKLGYFDTAVMASLRYKAAKRAYIQKKADEYRESIDPRVYDALIWYLS